jgi:hypothetical protein
MAQRVDRFELVASSWLSSEWPAPEQGHRTYLQKQLILCSFRAVGTRDIALSPAATTLRDSERSLILHTLEAANSESRVAISPSFADAVELTTQSFHFALAARGSLHAQPWLPQSAA